MQTVQAALNYADGASPHPVRIRDARDLNSTPKIDCEGFELREWPTAVTDFQDADEVRRVYYPEMAALLKEVTGAMRVVPFEHDVRRNADHRRTNVREPVRVVHDDYTEVSAPGRARLYLPNEADELLQRRYSVINVWRPINHPVYDSPLAVCDARSINPSDIIPTTGGVKHEVYLFKFSRCHRWYYFSTMRPGEVLVLKCFDSIHDGRARLTAHSAFDDPTASPDAPPRESIEVRALVFFD